MSREWATNNGHPDHLSAEEIAACVAILRPALAALARERQAARRRPGTAA